MLAEQFPSLPDISQNEVASIYAQAAFRLGSFKPARILSEDEYLSAHSQLTENFFTRDHTLSAVTDQFGPPSHEVVGGQTTVICFASSDIATDWLYFDFSRCYPPIDGVTYEWFGEPCLRDVRRNGCQFELLPFAHWLAETRADG